MRRLLLTGALLVVGCAADAATSATPDLLVSRSQTGLVPLVDLHQSYMGLSGGLYGDGENALTGAGLASAMDAAGRVSVAGRWALLFIGMSNLSMEACCLVGWGPNGTPTPTSIEARAAADPVVEHAHMVLVNGAIYGQTNVAWDSAADSAYDLVRSARLAPAGLTESDVRVVIFKAANTRPTVSLPLPSADAWEVARSTGAVIRALRTRYPNLQMVFLVSRTYGGYAKVYLNPEPYAYEGGFGIQRVVRAKLVQDSTGIVDPLVGDLSGVWVGWGPYLWADGTTPRSDGLRWLSSDFLIDGTHPSASGVAKVSTQFGRFFKTMPYTACWFTTTAAPC